MPHVKEYIVKQICKKINDSYNLVATGSLNKEDVFELRITVPDNTSAQLLVTLGYLIGTHESLEWTKYIINSKQ